ncbi:hypothetical protein KO498_02310 [Lentibacter algarum]|uniref:hypothetical protein n=1 Tax=Lentibacter algarum TaxID=576131 RepID=UPI001C06DFDA|nr:hypothetical protein [Lentibacter algarum]MBU2980638.1 hypothetical protein [Lentibacter algarum]
MSGFEEFTEAVATVSVNERAASGPDLSKVAVLGGGADACLLAALALSEGAEVTLFSAYGTELEAIRASSGISLRGAGPVGTYQVDRERGPSIQTTAELDRAVGRADVIFLTGPVHKYRTYAMVLADHLADGQIIVLPEGRSLGALETAWLLRTGGCTADVTIVEAQGLPFWVDAKGTVLTLTERSQIPAATLPAGRNEVIAALGQLMPRLSATDSVLASGFADGSALVELPALLMAGEGSKLPMGAVALPENDTFAASLGVQQRSVIDQLAGERRAVAKAFGVRNLPDTDTWITQYAGAFKGAAARPLPTQIEQTLRDGVIGSLIPLISAAALTSTPVPVTQAIVTLAAAVLPADVASAGRRLETIGITATDIDTARKAMDTIAKGGR